MKMHDKTYIKGFQLCKSINKRVEEIHKNVKHSVDL